MQPQAHVQLLNNIIDFGMDPQVALDAPRLCYTDGRQVAFEKQLQEDMEGGLSNRGHEIVFDLPTGFTFGGGQIIMVHPETGSLVAGSDPRKDGCAAAL